HMIRPAPDSTLFPYTTLFRSSPQLLPQGLKGLRVGRATHEAIKGGPGGGPGGPSGSIRVLPLQEFVHHVCVHRAEHAVPEGSGQDRKSTRLNSSHVKISYAVF